MLKNYILNNNNHNDSKDYYNLYLKYKNKYLQLKNILGGAEKKAKNFFDSFLKNKPAILNTLYEKDLFFKQLLDGNKININETDEIFEVIKDELNNNKLIDNFIRIYLNQQLGVPNSLENKGRFLEASEKLDILRRNKIPDLKIPVVFDSLTDLENFITDNEEHFVEIDKKKIKKKNQEEKQKKIRKEGENDVETILNNENVVIYKPTTVAGSKCYGSNTKWCTAADNDNMFDVYNEEGPLYIIETKKIKPNKKFQLHLETNSLTNEIDEPVEINEIIKLLEDNQEFINWFNDLIDEYNKRKIVNNELLTKWLSRFIGTEFESLKKLTLGEDFNQPLGDSLKNLTNLKQLTFGEYFNQPLGYSLKNLTNLEQLTFGQSFNQPLGDSLKELTKLKQLTFGNYFNKPLGDSLKNLTNLEQLTFGIFFKQLLGDSLNNLTNLKQLTLDDNFGNKVIASKDVLNRIIKTSNIEIRNFEFYEIIKKNPKKYNYDSDSDSEDENEDEDKDNLSPKPKTTFEDEVFPEYEDTGSIFPL